MERIDEFCRTIVDATAQFAAAFKLNSAFFERLGVDGTLLLEETIGCIKDRHSDCLVILDAKRGDIDHTNTYYADAVFDTLGADVVTVHPSKGRQSLLPFLERTDKGIIVMAANSTLGAGEIQDLIIVSSGLPLDEHISRTVAAEWNTKNNCSVTAGATEAHKLARIRRAVGDMPILLLGLGAQGGNIDECLRMGRGRDCFGLIPNSSRAILFASDGPDYADAAHRAAEDFNQLLAAEP